MELLSLVASKSKENQMDISNLATIFGPSLMWPQNETQAVKDYFKCSNLLQFMLENLSYLKLCSHPGVYYLQSFEAQNKSNRNSKLTNQRQRAATVGIHSENGGSFVPLGEKIMNNNDILPMLQLGTPAGDGSILRHVDAVVGEHYNWQTTKPDTKNLLDTRHAKY